MPVALDRRPLPEVSIPLPVHFTIVSRQIVANQIGPDDSSAYDWSTSICALQWIAPAKDHSSDHNVEFDVSIDLFKNK